MYVEDVEIVGLNNLVQGPGADCRCFCFPPCATFASGCRVILSCGIGFASGLFGIINFFQIPEDRPGINIQHLGGTGPVALIFLQSLQNVIFLPFFPGLG